LNEGSPSSSSSKVVSLPELLRIRKAMAEAGKRVVFTNGCFDVLHRGHVDLLRAAREFGDALVVGVNDDASMRRLKGERRPLVPAEDRGEILAALEMVDRVVFFSEDDPGALIDALVPDVLVKGADYALDEIVGRDTVERAGGRVERVTLTPRKSTRGLIELVLERFANSPQVRASETPKGDR